MIKQKRGISPLISTILIISFTVLIAAFVFVWGSDTFVKYKEKTEFESIGSLECATKTTMNIKKGCILGDNVILQIANAGSRDIDSFLFRTKGTNNMNLFELNKTSGVYSSGVFEAEFDANRLTGLINPNEIDIFPRLLIQDKYFTCDKTSFNLKPCYLLPRLNVFKEDWSIVNGNPFADVIPEDMIENEKLDPGIFVLLKEDGAAEIKSIGFKIPQEVNNFHIRGKVNVNGNVKYELRHLDGSLAKTLIDKSNTLETLELKIIPTLEINDLIGEDVYLSITIDGVAGDYATLSELCYTNSNYCVI